MSAKQTPIHIRADDETVKMLEEVAKSHYEGNASLAVRSLIRAAHKKLKL